MQAKMKNTMLQQQCALVSRHLDAAETLLSHTSTAIPHVVGQIRESLETISAAQCLPQYPPRLDQQIQTMLGLSAQSLAAITGSQVGGIPSNLDEWAVDEFRAGMCLEVQRAALGAARTLCGHVEEQGLVVGPEEMRKVVNELLRARETAEDRWALRGLDMMSLDKTLGSLNALTIYLSSHLSSSTSELPTPPQSPADFHHPALKITPPLPTQDLPSPPYTAFAVPEEQSPLLKASPAPVFHLSKAGVRFALPQHHPIHSLALSSDGHVLSAHDAAGQAHLLVRTMGGPIAKIEVPSWDGDVDEVSRDVEYMEREPELRDTHVGIPVRVERLIGGDRPRVAVQFARVGFADHAPGKKKVLGLWRHTPKMVTTWVRKVVPDEGDVVNEYIDAVSGIAAWTMEDRSGKGQKDLPHVTVLDLVSDSITKLPGWHADTIQVSPEGEHIVVVHDTGRISICSRHVLNSKFESHSSHVEIDAFLGTKVRSKAKGRRLSAPIPSLYSTPARSILRGPAARVCVSRDSIAVAWPAYDAATLKCRGHFVGTVDLASHSSSSRLVLCENNIVYTHSCAFSADGRLFASLDVAKAYVADLSGSVTPVAEGEVAVAPATVLDMGGCRPRAATPAFMPDGKGVFVLGTDAVFEGRNGYGDVVFMYEAGPRKETIEGGDDDEPEARRWDLVSWVKGGRHSKEEKQG